MELFNLTRTCYPTLQSTPSLLKMAPFCMVESNLSLVSLWSVRLGYDSEDRAPFCLCIWLNWLRVKEFVYMKLLASTRLW